MGVWGNGWGWGQGRGGRVGDRHGLCALQKKNLCGSVKNNPDSYVQINVILWKRLEGGGQGLGGRRMGNGGGRDGGWRREGCLPSWLMCCTSLWLCRVGGVLPNICSFIYLNRSQVEGNVTSFVSFSC